LPAGAAAFEQVLALLRRASRSGDSSSARTTPNEKWRSSGRRGAADERVGPPSSVAAFSSALLPSPAGLEHDDAAGTSPTGAPQAAPRSSTARSISEARMEARRAAEASRRLTCAAAAGHRARSSHRRICPSLDRTTWATTLSLAIS
jgi:hypothetical protein